MKIKKFMKTQTLLAAIAMCFLLNTVKSSERENESLEAENLKKAIYCMELLELEKNLDQFCAECLGETYTQHTPWLADGKEALLEAFTRRFKKYPDFTIEIKRAAADDDLVWIHLLTKRSPDARGNAVVNIFRMEKGKFVEHWNVVQAVPENAKNDNTMF